MTADVIKTSPRWQGLELTGKRLDNGDMEPGKPIIVNCHGHTEVGLCGECAEDFGRVLADVPELLDDLDIAIAGEAKFVEHGIRGLVTEERGGGHPGVRAQQRLISALMVAADWFDTRNPARIATELALLLPQLVSEPRLPALARDISSAASRAHKVIERPADWVLYGPCPSCERDIWQERIHSAEETPVRCRFPNCNYAAPLHEHNRGQLAVVRDRWLTVEELVSAFTMAGQPLARHQVNNWAKRDGLPREMRPVLRWVDGMLKHVRDIATYRVGDVADMIEESEKRRAGVA